MAVGLLQRAVGPLHGNWMRRGAGDLVGGLGDDVGVGHIRLDIDDRRAVQQVDAGDPQAIGLHFVQLDH
ncbi:hypothetical protein D3C85_1710110 [compost metagenome]